MDFIQAHSPVSGPEQQGRASFGLQNAGNDSHSLERRSGQTIIDKAGKISEVVGNVAERTGEPIDVVMRDLVVSANDLALKHPDEPGAIREAVVADVAAIVEVANNPDQTELTTEALAQSSDAILGSALREVDAADPTGRIVELATGAIDDVAKEGVAMEKQADTLAQAEDVEEQQLIPEGDFRNRIVRKLQETKKEYTEFDITDTANEMARRYTFGRELDDHGYQVLEDILRTRDYQDRLLSQHVSERDLSELLRFKFNERMLHWVDQLTFKEAASGEKFDLEALAEEFPNLHTDSEKEQFAVTVVDKILKTGEDIRETILDVAEVVKIFAASKSLEIICKNNPAIVEAITDAAVRELNEGSYYTKNDWTEYKNVLTLLTSLTGSAPAQWKQRIASGEKLPIGVCRLVGNSQLDEVIRGVEVFDRLGRHEVCEEARGRLTELQDAVHSAIPNSIEHAAAKNRLRIQTEKIFQTLFDVEACSDSEKPVRQRMIKEFLGGDLRSFGLDKDGNFNTEGQRAIVRYISNIEALGADKLVEISQRFGILNFQRYSSETLKAISEIAEGVASDTELSVVIMGKDSDHNGAFTQGYRDMQLRSTVFYEVRSLDDVSKVKDDLHQLGCKFTRLTIAGHGGQRGVHVSSELLFGPEQAEQVSNPFCQIIALLEGDSEGHKSVILDSCSQGYNYEGAPSNAEKLSKHLGAAVVAAPGVSYSSPTPDGKIQWGSDDTAEFNKLRYQFTSERQKQHRKELRWQTRLARFLRLQRPSSAEITRLKQTIKEEVDQLLREHFKDKRMTTKVIAVDGVSTTSQGAVEIGT